jgi:hypothetical protein
MYCGKEEGREDVVRIARGEAKLAQKVVLDLVQDVQGKGHVTTMGNFFTSVGLLQELASMQIDATCTVRSNRVGLPLALKYRGAFRNTTHDTLEWKMHER